MFVVCWLSLVAVSGLPFLAVHGLLIVVASPVAERGLWSARASVVGAPGLWSTGSIVVALGLSCSEACGIFPDQESTPCLLHWQADSLPGKPNVQYT